MNNMHDILAKINLLEGKAAKPDFPDIDNDGDTTESIAKAAKEVAEASTGDYSAKKARAGKDIGKPGKQFSKIAADAAKRYGSKERGEKVAGAVLAKLRKEGVEEARHPQALDYQQGPEDDEEYRRHHGLDDPDRQRERRLRAQDYKTLDRLERQAVDRAKQIGEEDIDEVSRGEYIQQQDAKAERQGKKQFQAFGQKFSTDDVKESRRSALRLIKEHAVNDRSVKIYHDSEYDEFTVCLYHNQDQQKIFAEDRAQAIQLAKNWLNEGRNDPHPLDDPLTRFRKKHAPSVMRDPKGREEVSKLDVEYGERKKTAYGRGEEEDEDDEDGGKKKAKPAGEKRGRGRPKGTRRAIGAKGPTGRSKLLTRKEGVEEGSNTSRVWAKSAQEAYKMLGGKLPKGFAVNISVNDPNSVNKIASALQSSGYTTEPDDSIQDNGIRVISPKFEGGQKAQAAFLKLEDLVNRLGGEMTGGVSIHTLNQQGVAEDYDRDEYDEEGEMAKSQARTIEDAARELQDILDDDENLPEWVQKKIVLAKEYIDSARDYMKANPDEAEVDVEVGDEELVAEKAVSKAQRAAAGIAYAARKGDIPKSELRGASKEMADMPEKELKKFAKTKEKGLPEKVKEEDKEEVDETTTSGSVAVSDAAPKAKKGSMQFGKGVYEARLAEQFDQRMSAVMSESLDVSVTANADGTNTVSLTGKNVEPDVLMDLLTMAGMSQSRETVYQPVQAEPQGADFSSMLSTLDGLSGSEPMTAEAAACEVCGAHEGMHEQGCQRAMAMEADLANSANDTVTMDADYMTNELAGGLNGPKLQSNPNNMGDNPLAMKNLGTKASPNLNLGAVAEQVQQDLTDRLQELYKRIA